MRIPKSKRPPCKKCGAPSTHAEVWSEPTATIKLDGTVVRGQAERAEFFCSFHTGRKK